MINKNVWIIPVLTLVLLSVSSCNNKSPFLTSDLARISDAVAVNCEPFSGQQHQCLVFSQPWTQELKIYDLSAKTFVPSPIGIFPVAVKTGSLSKVLGTDSRLNYTYALDGIDGKIYVTPNTFNQNRASFSSPANIEIPSQASDLVFMSNDADRPVAVIAVPQARLLKRIVIDPHTGLADTSLSLADISGLSFEPQMLAASVDKKHLFISHAQGNSVGILKANALVPTLVDIGGPSLRAAAGYMDLGRGLENFAIVLRTDKPEAVIVSIDHEEVINRIKLEQLPIHIYIPQGQPASCCGGVHNWALMLSAFSRLSYLKLDNARTLSESEFNVTSRVDSVELAEGKLLGPKAALPVALIPGFANEGPQLCYIAFETGLVAQFNEGSVEVKALSVD